MAERPWTIQQRHCIDARGGTVFVSAAAGSGKTAVLIERIISLLCDGTQPLSIDNLLVVTFTKAAAAEMRSRLNERISEKLALDPHNRHLLRQQMLLPQATISTIDSFCAQLLREQATRLGISPRFRIAEDTALKLLKNDIATRVIEDAYRRGDADFIALCDNITGDSSDQKLTEQLLRIYEFIQAHPFPLQWLDRQQQCFEENHPISETIWGEILLSQAREDLTAARDALAQAIDDMAADDRLQAAYGASISLSLSATIEAITALDKGWDTAVKAIGMIPFDSLKALRGYEDTAFKEHIQSLRSYAKTLIEDTVSAYMMQSETEAMHDIAVAAPLIKALFDLVRRFTDAFSKAKAEQNMLDFNDMEHLALSLLATPNEDGTFTRTEIAKEIGARYTHIMVDEYQDTNATQDTLFSALSDDERNLFFVGDIKQSIYGFRQAMPTIFRNRRENSTPYNGIDFPASITLGNNFRSRRQVTNGVNFLFRRLMTKETGGIVYDEREELVSSAAFHAADDPAYNTELLIIQKKALSEALSSHQAEARLIGQRLLAMITQGFQVSDKGGLRQATYRDFCILLRSTSSAAPVFTKELQAMGIPVSSGTHESFFDCAEIRSALSILRTIDNPFLDIPLLGAMMSPIYGFSPDDVAAIRHAAKDAPLYTALRHAARRSDSPLQHRCKSFLATLDTYRTLSAAMPADKLIRRLYEDSDMLSVMSAKSGGSSRIANLRRLYDLARHFEDQDFRGLSAFVRYLDKLEEQHISVAASDKSSSNQNAVRIMTIHGSKGLEFPVVFLAGLGRQFNNASTKADILLHAEHGIGMTLRDRVAMQSFDPLPRKALAAAITRDERTEELRLLYVAMTRAKDKLIMLTTVQNLQSTVERLAIAARPDGSLSPSFILHASCMSDWVLAALTQHEAGQVLRAALTDGSITKATANELCIALALPENKITDEAAAEETVEQLSLDGVAERFSYSYPYAALGSIAAKVTASQTAHTATPHAAVHLAQPAFLSQGGLTPSQRGTATHLFLEHLSLSSPLSAEEQATDMVARGILSEVQRNALALPRLQRFMQSELAKRMADSPMLLREFAFAVERPIGHFGIALDGMPADAADELIMVQGIADAVFEENGELIIVDYKTDRVTRGEDLCERYRPQLDIYKDALSKALQKPVKAAIIYSFHLNDAFEV